MKVVVVGMIKLLLKGEGKEKMVDERMKRDGEDQYLYETKVAYRWGDQSQGVNWCWTSSRHTWSVTLRVISERQEDKTRKDRTMVEERGSMLTDKKRTMQEDWLPFVAKYHQLAKKPCSVGNFSIFTPYYHCCTFALPFQHRTLVTWLLLIHRIGQNCSDKDFKHMNHL